MVFVRSCAAVPTDDSGDAMTTPTRAEETARAIARRVIITVSTSSYNPVSFEREGLVADIAQALTAAHAQGWSAALEACAVAVCDLCKTDSPVIFIDGKALHNLGALVNCDAAAIREMKGQVPK